MAVGALALGVFLLARNNAPAVYVGIARSSWALLLHVFTGACATSALICLWLRRYAWARMCAVGQVTLILSGWALAQFPYLVPPDITVESAAAPRLTLELLLGTLAAGAIVLFPSLYYMLRIFKGRTGFITRDGK
jgi:cytochrome d ubiquinol oxidase subunit II